MTRTERNEFNYIRKSLRQLGIFQDGPHYGTTLTIRADGGEQYKTELHDLYTSLGFHPASVRVDRWMYDEKERIIYIYGLTWEDGDGVAQPWESLYTAEQKEMFADALRGDWTSAADWRGLREEAEEAFAEEAEKELAAETVETIRKAVEASPARSAWGRGVKTYAAELLDNLTEAVAGGWVTLSDVTSQNLLDRALLNGADDWWMFSEGGCSLVYDGDIAERLCNPTELKRTDGGRRNPNSLENWIDVQGRALYQAARLIAEKAAEVITK